MFRTWKLELKCESLGFDCCVDFTQWNCKLSTECKLSREVGVCDLANYTYTLESFWHVTVRHACGTIISSTLCRELAGGSFIVFMSAYLCNHNQYKNINPL